MDEIFFGVFQPREHEKCEVCGKIAELRPYGKNGEWICYPCGMQDEQTTNERLEKNLRKLGL